MERKLHCPNWRTGRIGWALVYEGFCGGSTETWMSSHLQGELARWLHHRNDRMLLTLTRVASSIAVYWHR